jgi:pimeloyl-ACP methyl ester carboxylesterase
VVAWHVAARFPERVERLVILNAPHPAAYEQHVRRNFAQALRSWYVLFFQLPWLPETGARAANWRGATRALVRTSRPDTFSPEVLARYRTAWSQPGAYPSMLNWYRAALRRPRAVLAARCQGTHHGADARDLGRP